MTPLDLDAIEALAAKALRSFGHGDECHHYLCTDVPCGGGEGCEARRDDSDCECWTDADEVLRVHVPAILAELRRLLAPPPGLDVPAMAYGQWRSVRDGAPLRGETWRDLGDEERAVWAAIVALVQRYSHAAERAAREMAEALAKWNGDGWRIASEDFAKTQRERDEARAEVERLRAELAARPAPEPARPADACPVCGGRAWGETFPETCLGCGWRRTAHPHVDRRGAGARAAAIVDGHSNACAQWGNDPACPGPADEGLPTPMEIAKRLVRDLDVCEADGPQGCARVGARAAYAATAAWLMAFADRHHDPGVRAAAGEIAKLGSGS